MKKHSRNVAPAFDLQDRLTNGILVSTVQKPFPFDRWKYETVVFRDDGAWVRIESWMYAEEAIATREHKRIAERYAPLTATQVRHLRVES